MQNICILIFVVLLSSQTYANISIDMNLYSETPWLKINSGYTTIKKSFEVQNTPRIRSQDSFGSCTGCTTSTIVQHKICNQGPNYTFTKDCKSIPPSEEVSQLHMLSKTNPISKQDEIGDDIAHMGLTLTPKSRAKTYSPSIRIALFALSKRAKDVLSEECLPFDKIVAEHEKITTDQILADLQKAENAFENRKYTTEASGYCPECAVLNKLFQLNLSNSQISSLAKENSDSFESFLYAIVFSSKKCEPMKNLPKFSLKYYPLDSQNVERSEFKAFIADNFLNKKNNHPLALSNLCIYKIKNKSQINYPERPACWSHELAITGYRIVCKPNGTDCKDELKLHNCWGNEWQKQNNDGWVDADSIISTVDANEDKIGMSRLAWLE